jgi:hypothetical protein
MKIETIKEVLIRRDNYSERDADLAIGEARKLVEEGADPEEILFELFGLEPDYIYDLLIY